MSKLMIAIDGSEGALKAVSYVGKQFAGLADAQVTLLHVLSAVPAEFWDDGHILNDKEKAQRQAVVDRWLANEEARSKPIFQAARKALTAAGLSGRRVNAKTVPADTDVAETILEQARGGGYDTVVLGRRGRSGVERFLMGSVASKVIDHATGLAVWVVE